MMAKAAELVIIPIVAAGAFALLLLMHHRATRLAACRWRDRPTMDDDEFVRACAIPDDPLQVEVVLAARRIIADLGTVPAGTIRPDDSFAHDLVQLPYWDGLDWIDFVFRVEREYRRKIPLAVFFEGMMPAGGRTADLRVRDVVRSVAMAATEGRMFERGSA